MDGRFAPRPLRTGRDWWAIRSLLVETTSAPLPGWNWDVRRWDGWRFHNERPVGMAVLRGQVAMWESRDGRLLGAVHPDGPGNAVIELRPGARDLEPSMIAWAAERLAAPDRASGAPGVAFEVLDRDHARRDVLVRLGFQELDVSGWRRRLDFGATAPAITPLSAGYAARTTTPAIGDCAAIAGLLNAAFGRSTHTAREYRTFVTRSLSFEHELNLVAVAPDGSFAAHVGPTLEPQSRHVIVEPVCTHPDHRRLGLARHLILEGLRRAHARGARTAAVDTGDGEAQNALYAGCGFVDADHFHAWRGPAGAPPAAPG